MSILYSLGYLETVAKDKVYGAPERQKFRFNVTDTTGFTSEYGHPDNKTIGTLSSGPLVSKSPEYCQCEHCNRLGQAAVPGGFGPRNSRSRGLPLQ